MPGTLMNYFQSTPNTGLKKKKASSSLLMELSSVTDAEKSDASNDVISAKIDRLEESMTKLHELMSSSKDETLSKLNEMDNNLKTLQQTVVVQEDKINDLKKENEMLKTYQQIYEGRLLRAEKKIADLQEQSYDIASRSMENNILFHKIPENQDENVSRVICNFLQKEMQFSDAEFKQILLQKAHRIGKKGAHHRPIIAVLNPIGAQIILKNAHRLKGKPFGISRQLPRTLEERRKDLIPVSKQAREAKQKVSWARDKLLINGTEYKRPHQRPEMYHPNAVHLATTMKITHSSMISDKGSTFLGSRAKVLDADNITPALYAINQNPYCAAATHNVYAYRFETPSGTVEGHEDDGEHGASKNILRCMQQEGINNTLICVSRHYGGRDLGPVRFKHYEDATKAVFES